jgi:hypothetical protein
MQTANFLVSNRENETGNQIRMGGGCYSQVFSKFSLDIIKATNFALEFKCLFLPKERLTRYATQLKKAIQVQKTLRQSSILSHSPF